jgi:nitroreductase
MTKQASVFDIIKERYSVRDYSSRPIEQEKLDIILESARLAHSACNVQPWHFYVVTDKKKIGAFSEKMPLGAQMVMNSFISEAPIVIVATAGPINILQKALSYIINKRWYYMDVSIAIEHMVLTAWEFGIGSCWIGWFDEKKIKKTLSIPRDREVVALLTLGYPNEVSKRPEKSRKKTEEITTFI